MSDTVNAVEAGSTPVPAEDPPANVLVAIGRFFFKWRNAFFPVVFVTAALLAGPRLAGGTLQSDRWLDAAGLAVGGLGLLIRAVTVGLDYIKRGGKKKRVYADRLVTGGVFAHGRNPLYVGNLLQVIGLVVIHNSPWMYAVVLPLFVFIYVCIVAAEEQFLRARFGVAYAAYCARVGRWTIRPTGWRRTLAGQRFDWAKLVRKEYGTPVSWITTAFALLAWEAVYNEGFPPSRTRLLILAVVWFPVGVFWVVARVMKKSGALGSDRAATANA